MERLANKDQSEAAIDGSQEHREPYFETPPFDDPTEYDTLKRSELRRELLERRKIENAQNEKITAQEKEIKKLKEELLFTQYLTASTSQDSGTENITEKSNDSLKVSNVEDNQVNSQEVFFDDGYDSLSEEEEEE